MIHGSFEVTRDVASSVDRVWSAYADPELRSRWYPIPSMAHSLDLREAGQELITGTIGREQITTRATFIDVEPRRRITLTYDVTINNVRRWVSLVSVAFESTAHGCSVVHHEAYTFLRWTGDGTDDVAHLEGSIRLRLNGLSSVAESRTTR